MRNEIDPDGPPQSQALSAPAEGSGPYREGTLVRLEAGGRLPDRCIRCNRPAEGRRAECSVFWRPVWWRWASWSSLTVLFFMGGAAALFINLFGIAVLAAVVADIVLRRKFVIDYGMCSGHRRLRTGVIASCAVSWVVLIGLVGAWWVGYRAAQYWWFWVVVVAAFALSVVASLLYRLRLKRLTADYMWLQGTGRPFYQGLPVATS
jgi:hypothetical protein